MIDFLARLQELQMDALVRGLNMKVTTYDADLKDKCGINVSVWDDLENDVLNCAFRADAMNREGMQELVAQIEDYIKKHKHEN